MYCKPHERLPGTSIRCRPNRPIYVNGLGANEYSGMSKMGQMIMPQFEKLTQGPQPQFGPQLVPNNDGSNDPISMLQSKSNFNSMATLGPGMLMPGLDPLISMLVMKTPLGKVTKPVLNVLEPFANIAKGLTSIITAPITKIFGGMFKKATHMESCMKWWTDANIRSMVLGIEPISIDFNSFLELYKADMPTYIKIRFEETRVTLANSGVVHLLANGRRKSRIADYYVQSIHENPDIKEMQCAAMPQGRAETGAQFDEAYMESNFFGPLREQAKEAEVQDTLNQMLITLKQRLDPILANVIQEQEKGFKEIQKQRTVATTFQLPTDVKSVSKKGVVELAVKGSPVQRKL